jgi:hypothetical protein
MYTSIVLHRNSMFLKLLSVGLSIDDPSLMVKCCHVAIESCNWELLQAVLHDSRCDMSSQNVSSTLIFLAASSLHAPSVLLLLQTMHAHNGASHVKTCINTVTSKGLTILNVLMLLLRSCERDPSGTGNPIQTKSTFFRQVTPTPHPLSANRASCCIPHVQMVSQCIECMRHVIDFGANPNFSDSQGSTLAEFCRANLSKETAELVLKLFSEPDVVRSQLIECVISNDSGALTAIIQQRSITEALDEHGLNLVFLAGTLGHLSCFQVLYRLAASPEHMRNFGALSLSHVAAYRGKSTIVSFLAESGVPVADVTHDLGVFVLTLRSTGFDLNTEASDATGYTPLLCAVVSIIELLVFY